MCRNDRQEDRTAFLTIMMLFALCFHGAEAFALDLGGHGHDTPVVMERVTVTAEKIEEYIQNHPQQVTAVERQEILERNFLSVEETLNSMPGVEVRPSAGIGSRISIRGSGKSGGVLVLLNGRPLNSSQYGGADLSTIPIEIVRSVTVFKPPVPVWLGPGASDGAISIITHDFQPKTDEKKRGKTRVRVSAGSFGLAEGSVSHVAPLTDGSAMVTAAGTRKDGRRSNNDKDKGTFSAHWDHKTESAVQYDLNGRYYISEYGSPGPTDNPTPDARQRYGKGSADFQIRGFAGEIGDYSLKAYADRVDLEDESQSGLTSDLKDLRFGMKADTTWSEESDIWALRVGGILERDDADHTITGDHHRVSAGLHAQYDRHFGPVTATLGLRGDHTSDFDFNPGFSGGLSYALSEKSLIRANAGYTVNVPTFGQLYQPAHGSYDQVRGNPDLDEENIWSYDLGAEYRFRKDRLIQATLFRTDTRDPIVYLRGDDLIYRPVNADRAWRHGIELAFKYAWDMGLSADVSYILQDSENRETGKELAYTPGHKFKTTLKYVLPRLDTRLETTLRYEAERFSEAEARESQKLDDFVTIDLKAVQPLTVREMPLELFINIYNLFDADFEFHHGYPDDGIRFVAGMNLTF
ncbi:TonB-dependent receptor [Desulfonema ishimotonii]|uniref:TonB-dependent receptor n=1 Tax=Desulfonema ishimotonii TaxID=45657 RepID=A0A401G031_9BACT|nr:TonB-dependent receptor [Desulfonema ishimotonii]GBC62543.1 TonB-dependent receptor [Desulfonema ishimotonii]